MREGWIEKRFDEVFSLQMGKTPDRKNFSLFEGGNIWVSIKDLEDKYISSSKECISDEAASNINIVKSGTVIMSFKLTIGKCAIAATDLYTNEAIMAFNTNDGYEIDPSFLYYYLQGYKWEGLNNAVMGLTLNKSTISKHKISFPTLLIQQTIASELDMITEMISKYNEQLKELDKLSQSIFYEMFGDPVENEKGWESYSLEKVCSSIVRGPFGSALKKEYFVNPDETTYKVYEQKHAIQKDAEIGNYYITKEKFNELSRFEVKSGDIIMSCSGTIGELYAIPLGSKKGLINQALLKFTLNEKICVSFFLFLMDCVKKDFTVRGTGLQNIGSVNIIKAMEFGLPPLPLQQSFARKIEAIEAMKSKVKEAKNEAETLLAARMQYWFE